MAFSSEAGRRLSRWSFLAYWADRSEPICYIKGSLALSRFAKRSELSLGVRSAPLGRTVPNVPPREPRVRPGQLAFDLSKPPKVSLMSLTVGKLTARGQSPLREPLEGERSRFEPCKAVREPNSGPGDVSIGDNFLVPVLIVASRE